MDTEPAQWEVREDASRAVLAALYLRTALGIREPAALPPLRGVPAAAAPADEELEAQWQQFWQMTVEPEAHPADVPLDLVDGFGTLVALPRTAEVLRRAAAPLAVDAVAYAEEAHRRAQLPEGDAAAWRNAVRDEERTRGRDSSAFLLKVEILPLEQRGAWWIGGLTIAVTDGLRSDVAAFGRTIRPFVADVF
ncbi:zinc-binding alcohol dehydrogenase [Microbacterium halophytorum]|uniref:zinc-binding alcohol dehydrogenase n=1 Tax=Microbacterium halophytorum TaxID=2067568 RepID=UPI000CFAF2FF|nr:zinc-binding alcohol dehydrogenase [Microbacterium halophytorum]